MFENVRLPEALTVRVKKLTHIFSRSMIIMQHPNSGWLRIWSTSTSIPGIRPLVFQNLLNHRIIRLFLVQVRGLLRFDMSPPPHPLFRLKIKASMMLRIDAAAEGHLSLRCAPPCSSCRQFMFLLRILRHFADLATDILVILF